MIDKFNWNLTSKKDKEKIEEIMIKEKKEEIMVIEENILKKETIRIEMDLLAVKKLMTDNQFENSNPTIEGRVKKYANLL